MSNFFRNGVTHNRFIGLSRELRASSTDAERHLWRHLRARQLSGVKFRRQHAFGPYILDFYADERLLVVELDGGGHFTPEQQARDAERTRFLELRGLRVLRFDNVAVLHHTEAVLTQILDTVSTTPSPRPSPRGRGDSTPHAPPCSPGQGSRPAATART